MQVLNKAESTLKNHVSRCTDFYDPYQIALCESSIKRVDGIRYMISGGRDHAERKIIVIYPDYVHQDELELPIEALRLTGKFTQGDLSHRDFLGGLLGLGLKREKIGDIFVGNGEAVVIAFHELCQFIHLNLDKIGRYGIQVEKIKFDEIKPPEERYKLINTTVASLRLDAIVGSGFEESRSSISKLIHHDRVKVNWKPVNNPAYTIEEGDIISFKGKGRIIIEEVAGLTKKDRYRIRIKRMI